jgi:SPOR domain
MADDNILRSYRSNEPVRRASAPPAGSRDVGGSDPLAELARLIGQSDPFAELERSSPAPRQRTEFAASDWRSTAAAMARESMRNPPPEEPHFEQVDSAIAAAKSLRATPNDQFVDSRSYVAPHVASHVVAPPLASHAAFDHPSDDYADNAYGDGPQVGGPIDARVHATRQDEAPQSAHDGENYFFDGAVAPADDRLYDDPPRARATNGLVTAIVLVGCGILGTAGAYGYRTYYSGVRPSDAPIISAEKSPNKVVPAPAESQSGKSVERVGAANERVVPRQEEPITLGDANNPRVVLPAPFTTSPGPGPSAQSGSPAQASAAVQSNPAALSATATEPKRVRTVAIRPDGADPTGRPISAAGTSAPQAAPPPATRPPPAAKPAAAPTHNGAGPLSIDPQGQPGDTASSYQAVPRERAPAPAPANPPPRLAAAAPAVSSGGYAVQISSQRSEADAQASFRSLQSKFPRELGDREVSVRRADLGQKGIYYRAMVGPFGTAGDADQFCNGLKAAGGTCLVQKN